MHFCVLQLCQKSKSYIWTLQKVNHLPFKPWYENAYSPYCSPYISYGTSKENLSKYQDILSLVITFFILISWMFEQLLVM